MSSAIEIGKRTCRTRPKSRCINLYTQPTSYAKYETDDSDTEFNKRKQQMTKFRTGSNYLCGRLIGTMQFG